MYVVVQQRDKLEALTRILDLESPSSAIVFCRTKREVDDLAANLDGRGYTSVAIHGDISQAQRERLLLAFREGRSELLIATEVAARGLDIPDVTHVFNFDIPDDADAYVHRIGRTGRMGRKGDAVTFVTPREIRQLQYIERAIRKNLREIRIPTPSDISERRRETLLASIVGAIESGVARPYAPLVKQLADEHDPLELAAAAIYLANGGPTGRHEDVTTVAPPDLPDGEGGMTLLYMDTGRQHGVRPKDVVDAFTTEAEIPPAAIGAIDMFGDFTLVEVERGAAERVLERAAVLVFRGREVHVTPARDKQRPDGPRPGAPHTPPKRPKFRKQRR